MISGETGCGKTTQVTQFILDDYIERGKGSTCRIVCTQPRRISAISVSAVRQTELLGQIVGFPSKPEGKWLPSSGSVNGNVFLAGLWVRGQVSEPSEWSSRWFALRIWKNSKWPLGEPALLSHVLVLHVKLKMSLRLQWTVRMAVPVPLDPIANSSFGSTHRFDI